MEVSYSAENTGITRILVVHLGHPVGGMEVNPTPQMRRFGPFELDPRAGELRKNGRRIRLQEQPLRILTMLLARPGEVVLREEIQQRLWPNQTVVEFDKGIHAAVLRLRTALSDSADKPRYVETVARRGYRFIGDLEPAEPAAHIPESEHCVDIPDTGDLVGKTVSHFRVVQKLGSGGMGIVYRAEDLKLGRQVALKFLRRPVSETGPELQERLRREARAAAALNHTHVCTIYDVEEVAGQPMIVMELLEGETLETRLAKGLVPFDEVLELGIQLARALDAGHRLGIVHRDLKPANIMLTRSGVKVLDFGIAKFLRHNRDGQETVTYSLTQAGAVIGTPRYMAPEQIAGLEVDPRCDIYAFGMVLNEVAAGRNAAFDRIVGACLAREPGSRVQSLYDVALQLEWLAKSGTDTNTPTKNRPLVFWGVLTAGVLMAVAAGGTFALKSLRPSQPPTELGPVHVLIAPPQGAMFGGGGSTCCDLLGGVFAVSPDGSKLAAIIVNREHSREVWVRSLSLMTETILPDTDGASKLFWSADSKSIGLFAHEKLKMTSAAGGPSRSIADVQRQGGGSWNHDGTILFSPDALLPLSRTSASEGAPQQATQLSENDMFGHWSPWFLPDGRRFLFVSRNRSDGNSAISLGSLDSVRRQRLVEGASMPAFAPNDHLLFIRGGRLWSQTFDPAKSRLVTEPALVGGDGQGSISRVAVFSVSENGVLVYRGGDPDAPRRLVWRSRDGHISGISGEPRSYTQVFLAPDEKAVAVNLTLDGKSSLWLLRLDSSVMSRISSEPTPVMNGFWSPDSQKLVFQVYRPEKTPLMTFTLGENSPRALFEDDHRNYPDDWSPDGKWILFRRDAGNVVFIIPADGNGKPTLLLDSRYPMDQFQFSPDGQWVAYNSLQSGQWEVYISRFPSLTETRQVSNGGGCQPIWRRDGRELFYLTEDGKLMIVPLSAGLLRQANAPKLLFPTRIPVNCSGSQYAASRDGQRFLMVEPDSEKESIESSEPLHVLINWTSSIKR
jgi:serine/threonine protein kinase